MFSDHAMIVYISRGLLSSINEPSVVLETIAELNGRLKNRVIINTYAVIDGKIYIIYCLIFPVPTECLKIKIKDIRY